MIVGGNGACGSGDGCNVGSVSGSGACCDDGVTDAGNGGGGYSDDSNGSGTSGAISKKTPSLLSPTL